jgi:hypothetical protein
MKYIIVKFKKKIKEEKGIALLFSLGILSLLLVLALGFATDAIISQKTAENNSNLTSARLLAEGTLERVKFALETATKAPWLLTSYSDTTTHPNADYPNMFVPSDDGNDEDNETSDMLGRISTDGVFSGIDNVVHQASDTLNAGQKYVRWEYISQVRDDGTYAITGRTAFIAIARAGINPQSLCNSTLSTEPAPSDATNPYEKVGQNVYEIYMPDLSTSANYIPKFGNDFPINVTMADAIANKNSSGFWPDLDAMFFELGIMDTANQARRDELSSLFMIGANPTDEAYWMDAHSFDGKVESDPTNAGYELYQRFNIAERTVPPPPATTKDWDSITIADITATPEKFYADTGTDTGVTGIKSPTDQNGLGIPWLANFGKTIDPATGATSDDDTLKATFSAVADRRNQIIANLIDYCDSNDTPTSDVTPGDFENLLTPDDWEAKAEAYHLNPTTEVRPAYTGNERTLYINRIATTGYLTFVGSHDVGPPETSTTTVAATGKIGAELVDVYGNIVGFETLSGNYKVKVYGKLTINLAHDATGGTSEAEDFIATITSFGALSSDGYTFKWDDSGAILSTKVITLERSGSVAPTITNASATIEVTSAVLFLDDNAVDFAKFSNSASSMTETCSFYSGQPGLGPSNTQSTDVFLMYTQAVDPRQNLNPGDWTKGNSKLTTLPTGASMGSTPPRSVRTSGDTEPDALSTNNGVGADNGTPRLSTAFIRNAPMTSLWEIGRIHRGAAWETINLKVYNEDLNVKFGAGGREYDKGDSNILDQVKMTSTSSSPTKINLLINNDTLMYRVLYGLINRVKIGQTPDSSAAGFTGGTAIDLSGFFCEDVFKQAIEKSKDFKSRGAISLVSNLTDGTCGVAQANDAQQEEIIGKITNLTTTLAGEAEYYSIVVLAQAIKDVGPDEGGIGAKVDIVKNIEGLGEITVEAQRNRYDRYVDEILAEQKIVVTLRRDTSSSPIKCKIIKFEFIED